MSLVSTAPRLWVLNFVALVGTMGIMAFVATVGPVVRLLELADWHAGLALTAGGVLWMLSARRWGKLSDKVGRKKVLVLSLTAYAVTYLILAICVEAALIRPPAIALSLALLVGTRALVGLFYAAVPTVTAAAVADQVPMGKRASAMAQLGTANAVGLVAGPMVAGWIALYDLRWALYAAALMPLLALGVVIWKMADTKPTAPLSSAPSPTTAKPVISFRDPRLRLPLVAVFVTMMAVAITQSTVGFLAIDRLAHSLSEGAKSAGYALTALGTGLILSQTLMMRIEWPPTRWLFMGAVLASAGFGAIALLNTPLPMYGAFALAGIGMGFVRPAVQALTADCVEAHEQGAAAGIVASMQGFSMIVGPLVGTLLYRTAPGAPYFLVMVLLLLLAMAVWRYHALESAKRCTGVIS